MKKFPLRKIIFFTSALFIVTGLFIYFCNRLVSLNSEGKIFDDKNEIPYNEVGLVPGTSKYLTNGRINHYFHYRIKAAAELYHHNKISHIIVSGDNHSKDYDEATDMMNSLIELGVPSSAITRDYAGYRTYDSMIRAKEIFRVQKFTVISQRFHNERAIFIADHNGMEVIGYNARDPFITTGTKVREVLAKVNAVLDIYILHPTPKYLGKKEPIIVQK